MINNNLVNITSFNKKISDHSPHMIGLKDINSRILYSNYVTARRYGFDSPEKAVGMSDFDFHTQGAEFAETFIQQDRRVIATNQQLKYFALHQWAYGEWNAHSVEKKLLVDKYKNVIGIYFIGVDIQKKNLLTMLIQNCRKTSLPLKTIGKRQYILEISKPYDVRNLTERQLECIYFLLRGYSCKEIAKLLLLSPRTVESYFEIIKQRLNCDSKRELVEKCIDLGIVNYIPKRLFMRASKEVVW